MAAAFWNNTNSVEYFISGYFMICRECGFWRFDEPVPFRPNARCPKCSCKALVVL